MNYFLKFPQAVFHRRAAHILFQNFALVKHHDIIHTVFPMHIFGHSLESLVLEYRWRWSFCKIVGHNECHHWLGTIQRTHMTNTAVGATKVKTKQ